MKAIYSMLLLVVPLAASASPFPEIIVGGCGGCSKANVDQPATPLKMLIDQPAKLLTHSRIGSIDESGEAVHVAGRVFDLTGAPRSGVVVYAFQVNSAQTRQTVANTSGEPHTFDGWALTDAKGNYSFDTVRPGSGTKEKPVPIHIAIRETGRCVYYIDDVVFSDNVRLADVQRQKATSARGGSGIVVPNKDVGGVWQVTRDIKLGLNVPGYEKCLQ